jgi:hypothetical protein
MQYEDNFYPPLNVSSRLKPACGQRALDLWAMIRLAHIPWGLGKGALLALLLPGDGFGDPGISHGTPKPAFVLGWYNVENLFDTEDDPLIRDEEFTPEGVRSYHAGLYRLKVQKVAKALGQMLSQVEVDAFGLCEVENARVLDDLILCTPLNRWNWFRVHREGPDPRGIDVAVFYRTDRVEVQNVHWSSVPLPEGRASREAVVLTLVRVSDPNDTLRTGWLHLPSQRSGSGSIRAEVWNKHKTNYPGVEVWLGDVNEGIGWALDKEVSRAGFTHFALSGKGTYFYRNTWSWLDRGWSTPAWLAEARPVFRPWMGHGERDLATGIAPPWRTWQGETWAGGPSDHYPILVKITRR